MSFSCGFDLLAELGQNENGNYASTVTLSAVDIETIAAYLGVVLRSDLRKEQISLLRNELNVQNRFLTEKIHEEDIVASDLYLRSPFVREVVANNRGTTK
jgi:hypothetical protein